MGKSLTLDIFDFFLVPIYLTTLYFLAYLIRPKVTTKQTKKHFIPALTF
jgi:hypothetical protein